MDPAPVSEPATALNKKVALPAELVSRLVTAAGHADSTAVAQAILAVDAHDTALASQLMNLAHESRYQEIITLLDS